MKNAACDILAIGGLGLLGAGAWLHYPPLAMMLVGGVVMLSGMVGAAIRAKGRR